jgi:tRNA A58 N-methylase Trm61
MSMTVCPWWLGSLLAHPLRRRIHDPADVLGPFVSEGMTVLEPGPGMGFFTVELARRVGPSGRVVAVDVQPRMLEGVLRRSGKEGLSDRIETRLASQDGMGLADLDGKVDFVLAFAVVHEMPDAERFFAEASSSMKQGASLLLAEPGFEVPEKEFADTLRMAGRYGLRTGRRLSIRWTRSAVLVKDRLPVVPGDTA